MSIDSAVGQGKCLQYGHVGYVSIYEHDVFFEFQDGLLKSVEVKNNSPPVADGRAKAHSTLLPKSDAEVCNLPCPLVERRRVSVLGKFLIVCRTTSLLTKDEAVAQLMFPADSQEQKWRWYFPLATS
jgi:hypothetical protein